MMQLKVTTADGKQKIVALDGKLPVMIGRSNEADIALPDKKVSRKHAVLSGNSSDSIFIEDMNSRTGTRVNGIPVSSKARLAPGDVIQIGETELIVEQVDDIPSTPPSTETGTQNNRLVAPPPATHGLPVYGSAGREDDGLYSEAMLKLARRIQNRAGTIEHRQLFRSGDD